MTHETISKLMLAGGVCHFGILFASAMVPRVLNWREELRTLSPLSRHLVWTHGAFIVLTIVAFGVISVAIPGELAGGSPAARALCGFVAVFWLTRLAIQLFLFDATPYLRTAGLKAGYHGLTVVFTFLAVAYGLAALRPVGGAS